VYSFTVTKRDASSIQLNFLYLITLELFRYTAVQPAGCNEHQQRTHLYPYYALNYRSFIAVRATTPKPSLRTAHTLLTIRTRRPSAGDMRTAVRQNAIFVFLYVHLQVTSSFFRKYFKTRSRASSSACQRPERYARPNFASDAIGTPEKRLGGHRDG
jgi:hypothetical protein